MRTVQMKEKLFCLKWQQHSKLEQSTEKYRQIKIIYQFWYFELLNIFFDLASVPHDFFPGPLFAQLQWESQRKLWLWNEHSYLYHGDFHFLQLWCHENQNIFQYISLSLLFKFDVIKTKKLPFINILLSGLDRGLPCSCGSFSSTTDIPGWIWL